jgi:hypothetical protein
MADERLRPRIKYSSERWRVERFATAGSTFELVVEVLGKPSSVMVVGSFRRLHHEASGVRNFKSDGPLRILMVGPLVEHDPAVTPEV